MKTTRTPNLNNPKVQEFKRREVQQRLAILRALQPKKVFVSRPAKPSNPYNGAVLAFIS